MYDLFVQLTVHLEHIENLAADTHGIPIPLNNEAFYPRRQDTTSEAADNEDDADKEENEDQGKEENQEQQEDEEEQQEEVLIGAEEARRQARQRNALAVLRATPAQPSIGVTTPNTWS